MFAMNSPAVKKIWVGLGLVFFGLSWVIAIDPRPFLKFGYPGVLVFNLVGPGALLIPSLALYMNVYVLAIVSALGMAVNDSISWWVGKNGDVLLPRGDKVIRAEKVLQKYGPWGLFFWALIPFPYDVIGVIAGYMEIKFWAFFIPTFAGRLIRFLILGLGVLAVYGK